MWVAKNKADLIIEVWEKLDCESIGAVEIEAIEVAVRDRFGEAAVDSPMKIARLLADEGAVLRHSEIMGLFVARNRDKPYTAEFRNIFRFDTFETAASTLRRLENLRLKFAEDKDKEGLRLIRERSIAAKKHLMSGTAAEIEIGNWITVWLQTPLAFETWLTLRRASPDFQNRFPGSAS